MSPTQFVELCKQDNCHLPLAFGISDLVCQMEPYKAEDQSEAWPASYVNRTIVTADINACSFSLQLQE